MTGLELLVAWGNLPFLRNLFHQSLYRQYRLHATHGFHVIKRSSPKRVVKRKVHLDFSGQTQFNPILAHGTPPVRQSATGLLVSPMPEFVVVRIEDNREQAQDSRQQVALALREEVMPTQLRWLAVAFFLPYVLVARSTQLPKKPLDRVQVLALLVGSVPSQRVAMLVQERGIDFEPTDDYREILKTPGAEDALLSALREAKPGKPTVIVNVDEEARKI